MIPADGIREIQKSFIYHASGPVGKGCFAIAVISMMVNGFARLLEAPRVQGWCTLVMGCCIVGFGIGCVLARNDQEPGNWRSFLDRWFINRPLAIANGLFMIMSCGFAIGILGVREGLPDMLPAIASLLDTTAETLLLLTLGSLGIALVLSRSDPNSTRDDEVEKRIFIRLGGAFLLGIAVLTLASCDSKPAADHPSDTLTTVDAWRDNSPHKSEDLVIDGVRMHYLDWGGTGTPMIFLHGLGNSAHIFDEIAPRFTDRFHVMALTYRGHGESEDPRRGYTMERLSQDVLAFLDSMKIDRAILVGHSMSGAVITRLASDHPERVERLIYLDAAKEYTELDSALALRPSKRPTPTSSDLESMLAYREWLRKNQYGFWSDALEADLRAASTTQQTSQALLDDLKRAPLDYTRIAAPSLAIFSIANRSTEFPWLEGTSDSTLDRSIDDYLKNGINAWSTRSRQRFEREARRPRSTTTIEASHYLFIDATERTVAAMREFLVGG